MHKLTTGVSLTLLSLPGLSLLLVACVDNIPTTAAPSTTAATSAANATTAAAGTTAVATTAASVTTAAAANSSAKGKVVVSSKNITESILIGEMYAAVLEQAGIAVERKMNLGMVQITHAAITKGEISLYPEYTGTAFLNVLKLPG